MDDSFTSHDTSVNPLPLVLAGPILRHVASREIVLWLVGTEAFSLRLTLSLEGRSEYLVDRQLADEVHYIQIGTHAYIHLIHVHFDSPLPKDERIAYDLAIGCRDGGAEQWIKDWAPHLCLPGERCPEFVLKSRLDRVLHGSCRRPHHPSADGLVRVDRELLESNGDIEQRPALLLMTGDQIYADDVAGPMLRAIHGLIERLGLFDEVLRGSVLEHSRTLRSHPDTYYRREELLPAGKASEAVVERFIGGARKPVFTTANAQNHLISLNELLAMYLLVWSPVGWQLTEITEPELAEVHSRRFKRERTHIEAFVETLPSAARALAHFPCYMVFDDHDISDDWNLSADWEATAYGHPFSKRIIGNALIAYMLCQGWGNTPSAFSGLLPLAGKLLNGAEDSLDDTAQEALIDQLLRFQNWGYSLATTPPVVVLDTRTRRWRSEISRSRPSGLMDWEALTEFQQELIGKEAVIVVSPAPMFGVKLIEIIQRIFTFFGRPLVVDAENWMAHAGSAYALFNIFRHTSTPHHFVILSGDVHYSFVYDVRLRRRPETPKIWQITSSGIKNEFPKSLLEWLDRLNRWLYAPRSPLNWFTKRRRMHIEPRLPTGREAGERLWNNAGIGLVVLNEKGEPTEIRQLNATEGETQFLQRND